MEVLFLAGAKSKERVLGIPECGKMGIDPLIATEDGSFGIKGMATDLLERELLVGQYDSTVLYACGPMRMLARVSQMAYQFTVPCQVLLESRMACGVGACLGCTVKFREEGSREDGRGGPSSAPEESAPEIEGECGLEAKREGLLPVISEAPPFRYARACKEGPVFDTRKIFLD